jgi:hypothetical protein
VALYVDVGQETQSAGKRVGPHEIDRPVGRGGIVGVYLAHRACGRFEQKVAIRLIDLPLATDLLRESFRYWPVPFGAPIQEGNCHPRSRMD